MEDSKNGYQTSDLYEASSLFATGAKLLGLEGNPHNNRINFIFEESLELEQISNSFINGKLTGNIKEFINAWRHLRRLIDRFEKGEMKNGKNFKRPN